MEEKKERTCERCGLEKELKQYKPNLGKHPGKTVNVCGDCAGKDNKLLAIEAPVGVPDIDPAVPAEKTAPINIVNHEPATAMATVEKVPIKEFKAVAPEPIQIATPKSEPKPEPPESGDPVENKPVCTEPISREEIRKKLTDCEKDADKLRESKQRVLAQAEQVRTKLQEVQKMINVTNVRIANYRDILGEKG